MTMVSETQPDNLRERLFETIARQDDTVLRPGRGGLSQGSSPGLRNDRREEDLPHLSESFA